MTITDYLDPENAKTCPGCKAWPEDCECEMLDEMDRIVLGYCDVIDPITDLAIGRSTPHPNGGVHCRNWRPRS